MMMDEDIYQIRQLFRTDSLTGVGNMIGFYEDLHARIESRSDAPFSLISVDICDLKTVNDKFGGSAGDSTVRWFALVLSEETEGMVYRIGGDEFAVILNDASFGSIPAVLQRLEKRFNQEGQQEYLEPPVAHIAAVNFSNISEWTLSRVMGIIYSVIEKRKTSTRGEFHIFDADLIPDVENLNTSTIDMIEKLAQVGGLLDQSLEMAFTDSVSGLPNLNAASRYLNRLQQSMEGAGSPFSIFIIDGDNLGQYNKISYQQGDYMIKKLGETLKKAVRPNDFIARWRSGDEFFVVLPDVGPEEALVIGDRFREAVRTESQDWQFPVTISIGVASYPVDGGTIDELIDQGELALRMAKQRGKNCVATASQG